MFSLRSAPYAFSESEHGATGNKGRTRNGERAHGAFEPVHDPVSDRCACISLDLLLSFGVGVVPLAQLVVGLKNSVADHGMEAPELSPPVALHVFFPVTAILGAIGHQLSDIVGRHACSDQGVDVILAEPTRGRGAITAATGGCSGCSSVGEGGGVACGGGVSVLLCPDVVALALGTGSGVGLRRRAERVVQVVEPVESLLDIRTVSLRGTVLSGCWRNEHTVLAHLKEASDFLVSHAILCGHENGQNRSQSKRFHLLLFSNKSIIISQQYISF